MDLQIVLAAGKKHYRRPHCSDVFLFFLNIKFIVYSGSTQPNYNQDNNRRQRPPIFFDELDELTCLRPPYLPVEFCFHLIYIIALLVRRES